MLRVASFQSQIGSSDATRCVRNDTTSVFPQKSEMSGSLHVRALGALRLDLVLLTVSSGRFHF